MWHSPGVLRLWHDVVWRDCVGLVRRFFGVSLCGSLSIDGFHTTASVCPVGVKERSLIINTFLESCDLRRSFCGIIRDGESDEISRVDVAQGIYGEFQRAGSVPASRSVRANATFAYSAERFKPVFRQSVSILNRPVS